MPVSKWVNLPPAEREQRRVRAQQGRDRYQAWRRQCDANREILLAKLAQEPNMVPLTGPFNYTIREIQTPDGALFQKIPQWPGGVWNGMPVPAEVYHTVEELDALHREWVLSGRKRAWEELPGLLRKRRNRLARQRALRQSTERGQTVTPSPSMATALYRAFDAGNKLLYVGITDNLGRRHSKHTKRSSWSAFVIRTEIAWYANRTDALVAEAIAIRCEQPLFNHEHNNSPEARERLVAYLIGKGRLDLLAPAVSRG